MNTATNKRRKIIGASLILLGLAILATGCGSEAQADIGTQNRVDNDTYITTLDDGTKCAVLYAGSYGGLGSIDCDWENAK